MNGLYSRWQKEFLVEDLVTFRLAFGVTDYGSICSNVNEFDSVSIENIRVYCDWEG